MSKDLLLEVFKKAKEKQTIDEEFIRFLDTIFPDKSINVMDVIKRGITKYMCEPSKRIVWTAMGENQEHLIYPKLYCSCQDFYKSVIVNRKRDFCKHILAQIICETLNNYKKVRLKDNKFEELVRDFKLNV